MQESAELRLLTAIQQQVSLLAQDQRERHNENVERLQTIEVDVKTVEQDVKRINGQVARHDERIRTLFAKRSKDGSDALTLVELMRYLALAGLCISATYWVLVVLLGFKK